MSSVNQRIEKLKRLELARAGYEGLVHRTWLNTGFSPKPFVLLRLEYQPFLPPIAKPCIRSIDVVPTTVSRISPNPSADSIILPFQYPSAPRLMSRRATTQTFATRRTTVCRYFISVPVGRRPHPTKIGACVDYSTLPSSSL